MSSFGHTVRKMTAGELDKVRRLTERCPEHPYQCGTLRCTASPTLVCSYRYVTGRAGRVTRADREYCQQHAEAFAKKNGVALPEAQAPHPPPVTDKGTEHAYPVITHDR